MKTKELAKKLFVIALVTVLSFTAIFATAKYIQQTADEKNSKEDFIQIESAINSEITDETISENTEKSEQELAYEKYQQLLSQNDDFIGILDGAQHPRHDHHRYGKGHRGRSCRDCADRRALLCRRRQPRLYLQVALCHPRRQV